MSGEGFFSWERQVQPVVSHNAAASTPALAASPGSQRSRERVPNLMAGQAALQQSEAGSSSPAPLEKFQVYCTRGFHYIVGSDKAESAFRVLKLSRHGGPELEAFEDATIYSKSQCSALLSQIHAGNLLHKGLQLVCEVSAILSRILSAACKAGPTQVTDNAPYGAALPDMRQCRCHHSSSRSGPANRCCFMPAHPAAGTPRILHE